MASQSCQFWSYPIPSTLTVSVPHPSLAALPPGLVVDALVASVPARKGRAVQVVCTPQRVAETAVTDWGGLTLESLVPGSLVQVRCYAFECDMRG